MQDLIDTYGYAAVLVGTFLEGETVLILGGLAARLGYLKLQWVIAAAFIGSLAGDQLYYYLGRRHGKTLLARHASWHRQVAKINDVMERFEIPLLIGFRFFYGFRTVTPFVIGMSRIKFVKFLLLNTLGALLWAVSIGSAGYVFGHALNILLGDIKRYELLSFAVIAIAGLVIWSLHFFLRRRQRHGSRTETASRSHH